MDTELDILIRAISDEKSADEATKQLVNRVFSKLKDGAIKLPINSKLDKSELKKLDDNVKQARKEVVDRYNKLQKEMANPKGFDAFSEKAINELVELGKAYAKFNSKASGQSKNSTKAISDVKSALGDVFQLYENKIKLLNSKIKELNLQDKISRQLSSTRNKRGSKNAEAYDRYLDKQEQHSKRAEGAAKRKELLNELDYVRKNKSPGSLGNKVIRGVVTKQTLQETEYSGSYPSGFARQMARSRAEARKRELASLRVEKNKEKAEQHADDLENGRVKYDAKQRVETRKPNGQIDISYEDTEVYNKKPKHYTNEENNELKRDVATNELAKILGGIEHQRKDVSVQLFKDYMTGAFTFNKASGNNDWKVIQETLEKTLNRYRGDKGTLGITDGNEKGVFGGHAEAIAAIKEMLAYIKEVAEQSSEQSEISAENARQLRELAKIDPKAANKLAEELMGIPHYEKSNATVEGNSLIAKEISKVKQATDETLKAVRNGTKATETQTISDKVENVRESIADSNEEKVVSTTRDINRDIAHATKIDSTTGFNTDTTANALIDVVKNILRELTIINKNTKKTEENVKKSTKTEKSTKTANKKKVEKRTGLNKFAVDEEFAKDTVWDKNEQDEKQTKVESKIPDVIELPSDIKSTYKALADATRLTLNKPDGRRRKISKGLIDETPWRKSLPNIQKSMTNALDVLRDSEGKPLVKGKTTKESTSASVNDFKTYNNELKNKRFKAKLDERETKLRDLAAKKNAEKAAKKTGSGEKPPFIPKVIVPEEPLYSNKVKKSSISATAKNQTIWDKFSDAILEATGAIDKYRSALDATAEEQDQMAAERITTHGLNNGRNPNDTGDIASIKRALELFRTNKRSIEDNPELAQKIQLTEGIEVDTTEITNAFSEALSGKQMRNAQMGGSIPRQIIGAMTGFVGMPSLEKSRAQADGLNQVLGNVNKAMQSVLSSIQMKETELSGMEKTGEVKFNKDGYIEEGSSAAYKTLADLEEYKLVLKTILADMKMVDQVVETTGGKFSKMSKLLSFSSPVLRENNDILRNITSGLDKNGKALKYQTRMAEILNYTFQLISRSIGQMLKNWIAQLNPITQIKRAFSDFASYNPKWQRTMNVVKYNLRDIILPIMEKIAQLLVNMIGFADIILQKVQAAFGQTPISLFDQKNAKKYKDEVEEIQNITAGFDELHDIGQDSEKDPNNLLGEIYKPQLSEEWKKFAEDIGNLFAGIITGDLGFGDVMKEILRLAVEGIKLIGGEIWKAIKNSKIGQYIEQNWTSLLGTLLAVFLGWKLLKVAGKMLWNALTGQLSGTAFGTLLSSWGTKFTTWISSAFTGSALKGTMATAGTSLGQVFAVAFVSVLAFVLGKALADWGAETLEENTNYNQGLLDGGGDPADKKSNVGGTIATIGGSALSGAGIGAAIGSVIPGVGTAIGAGIGAIIGGIAGTVRAVLVPAFEEAEIAARNMNNEMQNIEYYEGKVQAAKTKVTELDELMQLSNDTLEAQTDKVYELGEKYGVSSEKMNELVQAIKDGNYSTELAAGLNSELATALDTLDYHYGNNTELANKLAEAKRKLAREEMELAIAADISAGNFELATARLEYAMAAGLYTTDEAAAKMTQIMKETSFTEGQELLKNVSPELQAKWEQYVTDIDQGKRDIADIFGKMSDDERRELLNSNNEELKRKWVTYATTTEQGKRDLAKMYAEMNEEEREAFSKDYSGEAGSAMSKALDAMQREINSASWDWSHPFKSLKSMFTGDWGWKAEYASYDVGTNYVPSDGLAYLHKGEAVIPAKYNETMGIQGKAYHQNTAASQELLNAINRLEMTLNRGINVQGQFVQRGSDLVATVEKANNKLSNNILNNKIFAR